VHRYNPRGMARLHVNVDHVATVRQARGGSNPDPVSWALSAEQAGAHGITCHLRSDRRHIQDADLPRLRKSLATLLNLETSLEPEMLSIAAKSGAQCICLVPENRKEITTEGGLDARKEAKRIARALPSFAKKRQIVSLFVDPDLDQLEVAADLGAPFIELHTGRYANATGKERKRELGRLRKAAEFAHAKGLRVNAGHGLDYLNVRPIAMLPHVEELNIGHAIVSHALTVGVHLAVRQMLAQMGEAR
jgi:pyridoxine 5-phosphate synthase